MPRKPMEMVQVNLRIREKLRRRLEREAKKRGVSLNYEMTSRIEQGFDREAHRTIDVIASNIKSVWERFAREGKERSRQADLVNAVEHHIAQLPPEMREAEALKPTIEWMQKAVEAITRIHGRTYDFEPGEE